MIMVKLAMLMMISITPTAINTIVPVTNLIFKASRPRLELSSVSLFDRLEANSICYRFVLGHLGGNRSSSFH